METIKYGSGLFTTAQMVGNVIYSLCKIQVSGKENLDLLLGSILMLESVKKALDKRDADEDERMRKEEERLHALENGQGSGIPDQRIQPESQKRNSNNVCTERR